MAKRKNSTTTTTTTTDAAAVTISANTEENFVRGGASTLTPLEHREIANQAAKDLFDTVSQSNPKNESSIYLLFRAKLLPLQLMQNQLKRRESLTRSKRQQKYLLKQKNQSRIKYTLNN